MIVPTCSLDNELMLQRFNKHGLGPASSVVVAQLSIVVEAAGVHFACDCYKDGMVETCCSLEDLLARETPNYLRCHLMTLVFLTQLPIIVPAYRIYSCIMRPNLPLILGDND